MKKNRLMRIAALLLVLTLATSCFVGGTFAKYTSEFTAEDSARVAKWAFTFDGVDADFSTKKFNFTLFDTVYDIDTVADDEHVKDTATIIAPGTYGKVTIALQNVSEVDATYQVAFTAGDEAGVPLQWSTDGSTWKDNIADCNVAETDINMNASQNIVLYWKWAFTDDAIVEQTDVADTALGVTGTAAPTVTATVTLNQID